MSLLIINKAPVPICWQLLTISVIDTRITPAVISPALFLRNSTFIDVFSIKRLMWQDFYPKIFVIIDRFKQKIHFL